MILRKKNDKLNDSPESGEMIENCQGSANGAVMQDIPPTKVKTSEDGTMMEFKDEIEDEFDDLNDELEQVKGEVDGDRISLKSPINNKDAFEIVDEFMEEAEDAAGAKENGSNSGDDITDEISDGVNGQFNPLELCETSDILEECAEDEVDPLMEGSNDEEESQSHVQSGKRKLEDQDDGGVTVRKSSRLRSKAENKDLNKSSSPDKPKQKMLQKPSERPTQIGLDEDDVESSDMEVTEETTESNKENEVQLGDPTREPGKDAVKLIDYDFLQPFFHGWIRECVYKEMKSGPAVIDNIFYWPPNTSEDLGTKAREAKRKRRNKHDQERYFEDFPSDILSVNNFSFVKRELGLNNEAYEKITNAQPGMETRGEATRRSTRKVGSYKEVPEHQGLLETEDSEAESSDGGVEEVTDFDIGLPLTLQILSKSTPYREEHKKRKRFPDRRCCVTPPLAQDISWTQLDDDPLGVWTELRDDYNRDGWPEPEVPALLRAVRLTHPSTVTNIDKKLETIRSSLPDPLIRITADNKDLAGSEHLSSHDLAIRKYKHFSLINRPPVKHGAFMGNKKPPPSQVSRPGQVPASNQGFVKVRLPMQSSNGKRPVVELVMLTNGKYQPIKFTNNRQVTEAIPKRLFDQANTLRKTLYQRSVQVPKIGTKQVFLAINPTPGGVKPYSSVPGSPGSNNTSKPAATTPAKPPPAGDQVSILVRPSAGGNAVLLNVPRNVALKVKIGTTLSFSASTDQKYTVIDNKLHPPVGKQRPQQQQTSSNNRPQSTSRPTSNTHKPPSAASSASSRIPSLPSGVSIRPVAAGSRQSPVTSGRPSASSKPSLPPASLSIHAQISRKPLPQLQPRPAPARSEPVSNFTPCSPFCPGVTGIPELECGQCHSLFHPKCVGIPQWQVASVQGKFKCKGCAGGGNMTEIIDLE